MLPFINLKQMNNFLKFIMFVSIALTFVLAFYTLHDLQTAEGAGLYLSITFSQPTRTICDIIVDVAGMFLFFIAIFLPTIMLKHKSVESFFRLFSIYLAFMPIVHPGNVVHLLNAFQNLSIRTNLSDGALLKYLFQDLSPIFGILKVFLPFLFLVYTANRLTHTKKNSLPKWIFILLILLLLCFCLFENVTNHFLYLICYTLILWCFQELESLCRSIPRFATWSNIIIYGCLLRGIYRMLALISTTHV